MAGNVWNPNSPSTVGEEWLADLFGSQDLGAAGPWAQRIRSRAAETINVLKFWQSAVTLPPITPNNGQDVILCEIIPAGSEIPSGSVTTDTYQPSADGQVGSWRTQASGSSNLYQTIDEGVSTPNVADYINEPSGSTNYRARFGSSGFSATGRVLGMNIRMYGQGGGDFGFFVTVNLYHVASATSYPVGTVTSTLTSTLAIDEINPKTLLPWTPADVQGFSSGVWEVELVAGNIFSSVVALELQVIRQTVENRVAAATWVNGVGATQVAGLLSTQQFVGLPAAGASWSKPSSGDFTILVRRPRAQLVWGASGVPHNPIVPWLASKVASVEVACAVPGVVSARPTLDAYGQVTVCDFTSSSKGRTMPLLVMTSAPAVSQDSLPYYLADDTTHMPGVNNSQTVTQRFTAPASATFDFLRFVLRPGAATLPMTVKVKRVSDNVQMGNTITITPSDAAALTIQANNLRILSTAGVGAVLVSATQYYFEFASADLTALGSGWQLPMLGDTAIAGDAATFGGSTDFPQVAGISKTFADVPATLAQTPASPAGLTATKQLTVPASLQATQGCGVPTIETVRLSWSATALGSAFTRYEVQRTEDLGATWRDIGWGSVSESASIAFVDYEAPRGLPVQYRVRVVRSDGATSAYTAATASVTCGARGCEMLFVSNEQPSKACGYNREPGIDFGFIAPSRDQIWEIYGADYAVAFMESEDPGLSFSAFLTVNFGVAPTVDDVSIFAPVRAICRAATSYVCVLDYTGSRFFAHVQCAKGSWREPGFNYHAEIAVTEVTGSPSIAVF